MCVCVSKHTSVCVYACTCRPHVYEGVVDKDQLVEVELVGKALALSFVQDPFVVVIPAEHKHTPLYSKKNITETRPRLSV